VFRRQASRITTGIIADTLFVAVTRPAMAFGVPYGALLVTALLTLEAFLVTRNLLTLLLALPLHATSWLLCLAEPRFFDLITVWGTTRARAGFKGRRAGRIVTYGPFAPRPRTPTQQCVLMARTGIAGVAHVAF
jgi:type IV secretion system protein VirB3